MHYLGVCQGDDVARESSRHLHTAQILLSRSIPRAIIRLASSTHRRKKADIPDMLTIVTHGWVVDTVERQDIAVSTAGRGNNELQMYGLTWFYISFLPRQGGSASYALPADGGC